MGEILYLTCTIYILRGIRDSTLFGMVVSSTRDSSVVILQICREFCVYT